MPYGHSKCGDAIPDGQSASKAQTLGRELALAGPRTPRQKVSTPHGQGRIHVLDKLERESHLQFQPAIVGRF